MDMVRHFAVGKNCKLFVVGRTVKFLDGGTNKIRFNEQLLTVLGAEGQ